MVRGEKSSNDLFTWTLIRNSAVNVTRIRFSLIDQDDPTINTGFDQGTFPPNNLYIEMMGTGGNVG